MQFLLTLKIPYQLDYTYTKLIRTFLSNAFVLGVCFENRTFFDPKY